MGWGDLTTGLFRHTLSACSLKGATLSNPSEQFAEQYNKHIVRPIIKKLIRQGKTEIAAKAFDDIIERFFHLLPKKLAITPDGALRYMIHLGSTKKGLDILCIDCPNASRHLFQKDVLKESLLIEPIKNPSINDLRNILQLVDRTLEKIENQSTES